VRFHHPFREVYVEAKARLAIVVSEKKRKLRKEGRDDRIDEDTPDGYSKALWITVTKVWNVVVRSDNVSFANISSL